MSECGDTIKAVDADPEDLALGRIRDHACLVDEVIVRSAARQLTANRTLAGPTRIGQKMQLPLDETKSASLEPEDTTPQPQDAMNVWMVGQQASPSQRRGRYNQESFAHPAKMLPALARQIIETYSRPGMIVLDPMSGVGTTGVEALWLDRNYIGIEVESQYRDMQENNLKLAESQGASSEWKVLHGDARADHGISEVDLVAFSPPYQDAIHSQGNELARIARKIASGSASQELTRRFARFDALKESALAGTRSAGYSQNSDNVGHSQGDAYWASMSQIYRQAYDALKPGGYLAVVTKDQRDRKTGELVDLYGQTVALCRQLGFHLHQHVIALLCKLDETSGAVTHRTSHWQRMAVRKTAGTDRVVLLGQFEDVAVFRRPV